MSNDFSQSSAYSKRAERILVASSGHAQTHQKSITRASSSASSPKNPSGSSGGQIKRAIDKSTTRNVHEPNAAKRSKRGSSQRRVSFDDEVIPTSDDVHPLPDEPKTKSDLETKLAAAESRSETAQLALAEMTKQRDAATRATDAACAARDLLEVVKTQQAIMLSAVCEQMIAARAETAALQNHLLAVTMQRDAAYSELDAVNEQMAAVNRYVAQAEQEDGAHSQAASITVLASLEAAVSQRNAANAELSSIKSALASLLSGSTHNTQNDG